ncbi:MAG: Fic family protein [Francisellaceae bacterium]|jgi:Fic family protein|nr:Fic family protein [Francisellaceae bacterium]MBT6208219.1 Fic family protein [Francisellaceae bacterium]MBT6538587.1 Fic family protein [Francisellaceae bacterium]
MKIKKWIWEHPGWPNFEYYLNDTIHQRLYSYAKTFNGYPGLDNMPKEEYTDLIIDIMVAEATKSSQIEGENINPMEVRSSLMKQLGINEQTKIKPSLKANGIAQLMYMVRKDFSEPLSENMILKWHEQIMLGASPYTIFNSGIFRAKEDDMQIVSGPIGSEKIHYLAPPSTKINKEMARFIHWFNDKENIQLPGPIRAAIGHLYFECLHPFEDGNGRIGRAIVEKILSQEQNMPIMFSVSTVLHERRKEYYNELSKASGYSINITDWIGWFIEVIIDSVEKSREITDFTVRKAKFWKKYSDKLNSRQIVVLKRMFKEGPKGFDGGISAKKYIAMVEISKATATRDLAQLLELGCIYKLRSAGRSTRYNLKF